MKQAFPAQTGQQADQAVGVVAFEAKDREPFVAPIAQLHRRQRILLDAAGATYESEVAAGAPEHLLLELAETYACHAIVMGARGQGAAPDDTTGLGSVALAVLEASPLPVTVVRRAVADAADAGAAEDAPESPSTAG